MIVINCVIRISGFGVVFVRLSVLSIWVVDNYLRLVMIFWVI